MEKKSRVFGNNLQFYLQQKGIAPEQFAGKLGYSESEIRKIMDAWLFLDSQEKEQIAETLGMTVDALYEPLEDKYYESAGCFECRGEFSTEGNKEAILDLFDIYCDVQEILVEEGLKSSI